MAQFGKISGTVTDDQGNPLSGATVEVRRQGAFVTSTQAGPTYTVNDPGGIVVGDQVRINATSSPSRNVSAVAATTLTTSGPGLGTLNNNDRITVFSTLPTLYSDGLGAETKANPLTTDASGFWYAWAEIRPYDILETYGSTVRLKTDVVPEGQEYVQSNVFTGGPAIAFRYGTTRTITGGKLFVLENPIGVSEKFYVEHDGDVSTVGNFLGVNGVFSGNVTVTGDLTVDDIIADDITGQDLAATGTLTYSGAAGGLSLTAGSIETADLAANAVCTTTQGLGNADATAAAAAAYASGNYQDVAGATVTITPFAAASEIVVMALIHTENNGAGYAGYAAIRNGAGTILSESGFTDAAVTTGLTVSTEIVHRVTGLTGSQTFKLSHQCVSGTAYDVNDSTHAAKLRISRVVVVEHKK